MEPITSSNAAPNSAPHAAPLEVGPIQDLPLAHLRIMELGHYIAAPFATRILADLGAEIIKIEQPGYGDPVRGWGQQHEGHSPWWSVHGRNKKSITLNLKHPQARDILGLLVENCDGLIENFRAGQLEKMGYSDAFFRQNNSALPICHISGFGQDGPYRDRSSFGVIGEAVGGLRYLTNNAPGEANTPPVRVGISLGDSVAGLYAVIGLLASLLEGRSVGRTIDVALTESVLSLLEGTLPEYGVFGTVRQPMGGRIATAAPTNAFRTKDDGWFIIAANSDALFEKLCHLMGDETLHQDARFATNQARLANVEALEQQITSWTMRHTMDEMEILLLEANIPACRVFTVADIARDPQYRFRKMVQEVQDPFLGTVLHPGNVPHFADVKREVRWSGPIIGAHNDEIYGDFLGLTHEQREKLRCDGVI